MNTLKRVAVYCRVSTETELQEGSLALQMNYYRDFIHAHPDMQLVEVYDDKGKTGRNANRPGFQRLIADCEAGRIDMIITKSISRFARNVADCVEVVRRLKTLGIPVLFEKEGIDTMQGQGELILTILASMAQEESNSISQNMLWANERHNASGKPLFKPSYGYTKARRSWTWHVDEAQAKRVRYAFEQAAAGTCYSEIRKGLNAMEVVEETGLVWTFRRLRYMLTNVSYTGDCLTNKNYAVGHGLGARQNNGERPQYIIEEHHEPLVSRERFERVQQNIHSGMLRSRDMSRLHQRNAQRRSEQMPGQ